MPVRSSERPSGQQHVGTRCRCAAFPECSSLSVAGWCGGMAGLPAREQENRDRCRGVEASSSSKRCSPTSGPAGLAPLGRRFVVVVNVVIVEISELRWRRALFANTLEPTPGGLADLGCASLALL